MFILGHEMTGRYFELLISGHLVQFFIQERFIEHPLCTEDNKNVFHSKLFFNVEVIFLVKL